MRQDDDAEQGSGEPRSRRRLQIVSAHYPPNFVSGGTLVPQRQAKGFIERGWDVSVYAGHLDATAPPLTTRETVVDGVPVRWIEIEPFTSWDDRRNFDNPAVVADFEASLERARPDVVHLHSLQTLGGGMVRAASIAGARVVVTMHDFWWCCARQFLVDRSWVPCSLVVAAGVCECEVDRGWLAERNAWLAAQLEHADLILAPSSIAAEVLRANGVPMDRLEVDENGLEAVPGEVAHHPTERDGVTFRYVGGADRMKGSDVLRRAVLALSEEDRWQVVVHGDRGDLQALGPWPAQARLESSFGPEDLDEIMSRTDVLIVPSLMRESHSLVTREALLRGVPVICSDSLGPEDVVEPGRNGLVVPTGSSAVLADAMAQVIRNPERRTDWAAAATGVRVRLESERLDELSSRLASLADATPQERSPGERLIRRVVFVCGIDGAPLRYRAHLPAEGLRLHGVEADVVHYRDPSVDGLVAAADAIVLYRVPATHQVLALVDRVRRETPDVPVLFDVDDLIFDPDVADEIPALRILPPDEAALWMEGVRRYRTTMEACDAFIGSTRMLCDHASAVTGMPSHLFENGVGSVLARASDAALRCERAAGPLRVGYFSGTTTHDHDWRYIEDAVIDVLDDHPDVELVLGGHLNPTPALDRLGGRVHRLPMLDWLDLPQALRDLDVNLAPLEPGSRFNEAKSAIKWLEAALVATPTIAAPTGPFRAAIEAGVDGFMAGTPDEWRAALDSLLSDEVLRGGAGSRARRSALLGWPPHLQGARYLEILRSARGDLVELRGTWTSGWQPVANDEPPARSPLQHYGPREHHGTTSPPAPAPVALARGPRLLAAISRRAQAASRRVREDGWAEAGPLLARGALADARRVAGRVRRAARTRS